MPRVASEPSVLLAPHHNPGARHRSAGSESGDPSSPFAQLLDSADAPKAKERSDRAGRTSSTDASERRARPPESPDRPNDRTVNDRTVNDRTVNDRTVNDRTVDASQEPSPAATDPQPAEQTPADGAVACDAPKVERAKDDRELVDALAATLGNTDNTNITQPAPAVTVVPVSVELVLAAQGSGDGVAIEGDVAASVPAGAATPKVPLPEPAAPSPDNQATPSGETAQSPAQPTDTSEGVANEAVAPLAALLSEDAGAGQTTTPSDAGELPADGHAQAQESTAQSSKARGADAQATQVAQAGQDAKDAPGAKATTAAAPTDAGKPRPKPGPQSVASDDSDSNETIAASGTGKPADASGPESKDGAAAEPHHPHQHADAAKPDDQQPLGVQVSDAARNNRPPSEAVHAVLQAQDRPAGALAQAAPAQAASTTTSDVAIPIAGLAVEIAARAQQGSNHFDIRLDPPELGRIHVRLDIDSSGQVTSRLVVDRAETLEHLRRDAADLERSLQQAGLKTSQDGLQFSLRDQGFAGRNDNGSPSDAARLIVPDPDSAPPVDGLVAGYGRMARPGGIDIRI